MSTEEQNNELTDIALCYQSMGVPLDASPAQIEQMYKALTEENNRRQASADPAIRADAKQSQDLVNEMYEKIRGSITYRAMEKDYHKKGLDAQDNRQKRPAPQALIQNRTVLVNCPRCNGSITKGLKVCPICKYRLYTVTEQILRTYFTPKKLIVYGVILAAIAAGAVYLLNPDLFAGAKPEVDLFDAKGK